MKAFDAVTDPTLDVSRSRVFTRNRRRPNSEDADRRRAWRH